ncbi:hypothetical protein H2202_008997 [Exophiala xenobiotica]|nr:hypothetical protein H2202_008997 [Exophiala xenobiotica]KAK5204244.1 hypothetical protein LTR41_009978 [Exophiala xenobiotica]KAK5325933.1 hypothetical protein LTR93_004156 [Exophiala xenobiotica]KAK5362977.1 hypothetical protein LTS13_009303 [Exophiala xenobiotica]KAK5392046.1 hypothetical protein LTR79_010454 [Exophiala xenobiotica]
MTYHGDNTQFPNNPDLNIPLETRELVDAESCSVNDDLIHKTERDDAEGRQQQAVPRWLRYRPSSRDIKSQLLARLPRFLRPATIRTTKSLPPTAYLDAVRGYAAWLVFLTHTYKDQHWRWTNAPFLSVLMNAEGMVALFFVISGYVLGYRLLIHTHNRSSEQLLNSLASSTFRRGMRLYGSATVALFIVLVMMRLGWFDEDGLRLPSLVDQLVDWTWTLVEFLNPFGDIRGYYGDDRVHNKYLGPMWTIPVEFRGSMILFIYVAATCKLRPRTRMILTWISIIACYAWHVLYVAEFLMGMFIAEVGLMRHPERLSSSRAMAYIDPPKPSAQSMTSKICYTLLFAIGIFLLGQPSGTSLQWFGDWPWAFLKSWIPASCDYGGRLFWYLSIGAFLTILSLEMYPALQTPLKYGWSQYVGDLSFGIYALHPPIVITVFRQWYEPMRIETFGDGLLSHVPGLVLIHLLVFSAGDYFSMLDKRVVRMGRWMQEQFFEKW